MSADNPSFNHSIQKAYITHHSKLTSGALSNELLKNVEILEEENSQLKIALTELQEDLKDKENSIDESQKIITKLKDEYSKIIKELQNIEKINSKLISENELNKKEIENAKKANILLTKLQNKNNDLNTEINMLKKENISLKSKININNTSTNKKEKDLKNKDYIINNLKQKGDNWVLMIKERDKIISEQSKKINELNDIISRKTEELKLMMNFSKNINKENKTNISEITKQAVKTIKLFYNDMNKGNDNNSRDNGYRIQFKNSNNSTYQDFENILKNKNISFLLDDAINSMMYIPKNLKTVSKEFLMDMNFKTELIKSELYASIIRENQLVNFIKEIFGNFNIKDTDNLKSLYEIIIRVKNNFIKISKENKNLKKINKSLSEKNKNCELYIKSLKNEVKNNMNKIKEKNLTLISNFNSKIENIQNYSLLMKEKADKLSEEMVNLKSENIKLNNSIEEYKKLIDTQKENENLFKSLQEGKNKSNNKYINSFNNNLIQWNSVVKIETVISFNYIRSNPKIKPININNMPKINHSNYSNFINNSNMYTQAQSTKNSNYHKKKIEIKNLKEQVESVKNEMNNIMLTSINQNERFFTISNQDDIDNNDITSRSFIDNIKNNNKNNLQKNIKNLQKLLKKEKNKNVNLEKENNSLKEHINTLNMNLTEQFNNINSTNNTEMVLNNNIFTPKFFIKMFYDINQKIFSSSELKKYYKIYDVADLQTIFNIFVESCECLKNQLYESYFDMDSPNSDYEDNFISSKNMAIDSSYRLVNEKIMKLKKLEFDFANLSEFVKNYMVSQEIIVKIIFENDDDDFIQFEPIEKLFNLFEECLNFKIDEMSDNVIFYRKLLIRIFKNQKNCLGLSLEYLSQD